MELRRVFFLMVAVLVAGSAADTSTGLSPANASSLATDQQLQYDKLPSDCGLGSAKLIEHDVGCGLEEFPWMALLEYRTIELDELTEEHMLEVECPSLLIHKRYVLAPAHCVEVMNSDVWRLDAVRLGENLIGTTPDCMPGSTVCADDTVTIPIEETIVHEEYHSRALDRYYDVALLRLSRDAPFTKFIQPVCLPRTGDLASEFQTIIWNNTELGDAKIKQRLTLLTNLTTCRGKYRWEYSELFPLSNDELVNQVCTQAYSCWSDPGGPLMQLDQDKERWIAVGLLAHGPRLCLEPEWNGVYNKIYEFVPWILSKIKD